jgi:beta-lactamase regulating signal transducer with metallopeptidase domain
MNDMGSAVIASAIQVTIVATVAMLVYRWWFHRDTKSSSLIPSLTLVISILLTLVAFWPLPAWWTWNPAAPVRAEGSNVHPGCPDGDPDSPAASAPALAPANSAPTDRAELAFGKSLWHRIWDAMERARRSSTTNHWNWSETIAAILLAGTGLGLLHLLVGLWAVMNCCRGSQPIDDPGLGHMVEAMRTAMGCRGRIELREMADLSTPATVGWRRTLLLLPRDWREWSEAETRAVVAHELAHICQADFLANLLARVSVALHFYHPLVHWWAGRLQLQLELAADALGARFSGGRAPYLRALAKLALRQDGRHLSWPARTFLPARGSLMRRIHMLRADTSDQNTRYRRVRKWLMAVFLGTVAVCVSALRGPGKDPDPRTPPQVTEASKDAIRPNGDAKDVAVRPNDGPHAQFPAFDLTYAPHDALGVMCFRPAVFLGQPGMKNYVSEIDDGVTELLKMFGAKVRLPLSCADVEQILCSIQFKYNEKAPKGSRGSVVMQVVMVRAVKPFDWKSAIESLVPEIKEIQCGDQVYYEIPKFFIPFLTPPVHFYVPDDRTVVFDNETNLRGLIQKKSSTLPACVWTEGWKQVEHSMCAQAMDWGDKRLSEALKEDQEPKDTEAAILRLFYQTPNQLVAGFDLQDDFRFRILAKYHAEKDAQAIATNAKALIAVGRAALKAPREKAATGAELLLQQFGSQLLENMQVKQSGNKVSCVSDAKTKIAEFLDAALKVKRAD